MRVFDLACVTALFAFFSLPACAVGTTPCEPRAVYVAGPPPRPLPEQASAPPAPGMQRIDGYWHWAGRSYVWVPGHWVTPPPGQRWYAAKGTESGSGYCYQNGSFACEATSR